jgi:hypothetical protein
VKEKIGDCCRDFREAVDQALGNPVETLLACSKSKSKRLAKMEENIETKAVEGSILAEEDEVLRAE